MAPGDFWFFFLIFHLTFFGPNWKIPVFISFGLQLNFHSTNQLEILNSMKCSLDWAPELQNSFPKRPELLSLCMIVCEVRLLLRLLHKPCTTFAHFHSTFAVQPEVAVQQEIVISGQLTKRAWCPAQRYQFLTIVTDECVMSRFLSLVSWLPFLSYQLLFTYPLDYSFITSLINYQCSEIESFLDCNSDGFVIFFSTWSLSLFLSLINGPITENHGSMLSFTNSILQNGRRLWHLRCKPRVQ